MTNPTPWLTAIDAALAICEARLAACDAATAGPWTHDDEYLMGPIGADGQAELIAETSGRPISGKRDLAHICAARTDLPAALRRDVAGLHAHRGAEVERIEYIRLHGDTTCRRWWDCDVHRDYSARIFADCGVTLAAELAKEQE